MLSTVNEIAVQKEKQQNLMNNNVFKNRNVKPPQEKKTNSNINIFVRPGNRIRDLWRRSLMRYNMYLNHQDN